MKQKSYTLYLIIFALLALASTAILHHANKKPGALPKKVLGSFVNQATYQAFNREGKLSKVVTASHVTHFKGKKTTYFTQPTIITYTANRTPWHISAHHAKSDDESNQVLLWGHVIIHQLSPNHLTKTTIKTNALTFLPKQSRVTSPDEINIYRHDSVLHGKGFVANLKTGQYELLSQSKGIYNP